MWYEPATNKLIPSSIFQERQSNNDDNASYRINSERESYDCHHKWN